MSGARVPIAFLFDVDNTLLDNDRVRRDLVQAINRIVGPERGARFWELYEEIRQECDYVDFPHTLERFARIYPVETGFPALADAVLSYPYRSAAFPAAHEVLRHAGRIGPAAILTDGDPVYQPAKIARAGLAEEVSGRVFVFATRSITSTRYSSGCLPNATFSWTTSLGFSPPPRSGSGTGSSRSMSARASMPTRLTTTNSRPPIARLP